MPALGLMFHFGIDIQFQREGVSLFSPSSDKSLSNLPGDVLQRVKSANYNFRKRLNPISIRQNTEREFQNHLEVRVLIRQVLSFE